MLTHGELASPAYPQLPSPKFLTDFRSLMGLKKCIKNVLQKTILLKMPHFRITKMGKMPQG